jgi:hypothetical protein
MRGWENTYNNMVPEVVSLVKILTYTSTSSTVCFNVVKKDGEITAILYRRFLGGY